jgi:hypothetical protein
VRLIPVKNRRKEFIMYEVKVYGKGCVLIETKVFKTLEETIRFFDKYVFEYLIEINKLEDDSEDDLSDLPEYDDLILAITDDATFSDI